MELFINDTSIDINPSDLDTIQTMLDAVSQQLENSLIIASIEIDGTFSSMEDPIILNKKINTIEKVHLTVATNTEISISLLEDGKNFVKYSSEELKNGSISKKDQMIQAFAWIIESLHAVKNSLAFPPTDITMIGAEVNHIIKQLDQNHISIDSFSGIVEQLENVFDMMTSLQNKILNPEQYTKENVFGKINKALTLLPELASNFQTGNDLKAIQDLCIVIDTIEMYTRYASSQSEDTTSDNYAIDLKDISGQMLSAFENKDFILIADLLEYDLSEKFEDILQEG